MDCGLGLVQRRAQDHIYIYISMHYRVGDSSTMMVKPANEIKHETWNGHRDYKVSFRDSRT